MTAFADYTDLRVAVSEQVGNRNISDVLDRFTKQAEAWFNREIRTRDQLSISPVTFVSGEAPLPSNFIEVMALYDAFGLPIPAAVRGVAKPKSYGYSVTASGLYLKDANATLELEYYAKLPTLTASNTSTNWLLQKSPNIYLYAVSLEAAKWVKDVELSSAMAGLLKDEMESLGWADVRSRFGSSVIVTASYGP